MADDEIRERLSSASDICIKSYEAWRADEKSAPARESLMEAVHELRKVGARLEIELAISEREQMASKPIPIPPHRSQRKQHPVQDMNDDAGNYNHDSGAGNSMPSQPRGGPRRRRSSGGGGKSSD